MVERATRDVVVVLQVPGDGVGSGVQAGVGQLFAQAHDEVDDLDGVAAGEVWGAGTVVRMQPRPRAGTGPSGG